MMRHGEPAHSSETPADPELSALGSDQARSAVPYLRMAGVDVIYSSTQLRALQTAAVVAEALGLPVTVDEDLVEFDHGRTYAHFDAASPVWRSYFAGDLSPWGLTAEAFHGRIAAVVGRLLNRHRGERVLAVCHGGVINAWTCQALGVRQRLRLFEPAYASLHRYAHDDDGWQTIALNEVPALDIDK